MSRETDSANARSPRGTGQTPRAPVGVTLAIATLLLLAPLLGPVLGVGPLDLARPTPANLFAAHLFHLSLGHLLWSGVPSLLALAALEIEIGSRRALAVVLTSALVVSLAVLVLERGHLATYRGSSGVGHAFFVGWLVRDLRRRAPLAILLALKLGHELTTGALVWDPGLDLAGGIPVPVAHVAGALAGTMAALRHHAAA